MSTPNERWPTNIGRALSALALTACSSLAQAGVVVVSGQAEVIAPPSSVTQGQVESDNFVRIFAEQQNVTLGIAAPINASAAGLYNAVGTMVDSSLAIGSFISSYYLHSDRVGQSNTSTVFLQGSITFDTDILGIVIRPADLNSTDYLGAIGTNYGTSGEFDLDPIGDWFEISSDLRTLNFRTGTSSGSDVLRIFVAGSNEIPTPSSAMLGLLGLALLASSRRKPV